MTNAKTTMPRAARPRHDDGFLREILDGALTAIAVTDRQGNLLYTNPAFARLFDSEPGGISTLEDWYRRTAPTPAQADERLTLWRRDLASDCPPEREFPMTTGSGAECWCRVQMAFMKDGNVILNIQDVTHHRSVEERYHAFFEQAEDAILLRDVESGALLDFNRRAHEMLGYTREEFAGIDPSEHRAGMSPKEAQATLDEVLKSGAGVMDGQLRTKNGDILNVRTNCRVLRTGNRQILQLIIRDLTGHTQAETALRESEEKFRNLSEQSPNMIFINRGGRVVYANTKCEEIMGYSRTELYSPQFNFMKLVSPEYHTLTSGYFRRHAEGREVPSYEYVIVTKSGTRIPAIVSTKLIRFEGQPAILGIITDLSDLKYAEASLQEAATKLRAQKQELEEKNTAMKEILAQIETEKLGIKRQVSANVDKFILPLLHKMRSRRDASDQRDLDLMESSIRNLTSGFGVRIGNQPTALSARETEICNMIKSGLTTKEISTLLQVSVRTVDTYRNRIRKKLGISSHRVNLFTHIQTLT